MRVAPTCVLQVLTARLHFVQPMFQSGTPLYTQHEDVKDALQHITQVHAHRKGQLDDLHARLHQLWKQLGVGPDDVPMVRVCAASRARSVCRLATPDSWCLCHSSLIRSASHAWVTTCPILVSASTRLKSASLSRRRCGCLLVVRESSTLGNASPAVCFTGKPH